LLYSLAGLATGARNRRVQTCKGVLACDELGLPQGGMVITSTANIEDQIEGHGR
jgi:hypothetical protein